jgi:hypothetical protein
MEFTDNDEGQLMLLQQGSAYLCEIGRCVSIGFSGGERLIPSVHPLRR